MNFKKTDTVEIDLKKTNQKKKNKEEKLVGHICKGLVHGGGGGTLRLVNDSRTDLR